ncbi:uncharacterized protein LOC106671067 [Cimex lectularius]|uniref:Uncharacterized protein n=1 Tax=Cimex lectularius TaxID=79782 RepID=A0A8I6S705_CIMLE|nr:uncharacterized protein LOC106671067 [Cimex lectularius]
MILKALSLILALGMGASGHFLPSLLPSPHRGQSQGHFWSEHEKNDESNSYLYQSPGYQQYSDYADFYHQQVPAHAPLSNPQLLQEPQVVYQQETPYQQLVQQQVLLPDVSYQQHLLPYQYLTRNQEPSTPLTAQTTIPLVVKFPNNEALVVPVKAVYTLPPFLERIVQRVQGYYSVYNPVENLTADRPLFHPSTPSTASGVPETTTGSPVKSKASTTESPEASTNANGENTTTSTNENSSDKEDDKDSENSTQEGSTISEMVTTTEAAEVSTDSTQTDLQNEGYTYNKPGRSFFH